MTFGLNVLWLLRLWLQQKWQQKQVYILQPQQQQAQGVEVEEEEDRCMHSKNRKTSMNRLQQAQAILYLLLPQISMQSVKNLANMLTFDFAAWTWPKSVSVDIIDNCSSSSSSSRGSLFVSWFVVAVIFSSFFFQPFTNWQHALCLTLKFECAASGTQCMRLFLKYIHMYVHACMWKYSQPHKRHCDFI